MALNHMTSEQRHRRFNLYKDLNFVENFLRNNLPSDIFWRIKEMTVRSFQYDFHFQWFVWLTNSVDFCLRSSRIWIFFYLRFCLGPATKNLSSKPLSGQQEVVLSKGSRFCFPTPISHSEIIS